MPAWQVNVALTLRREDSGSGIEVDIHLPSVLRTARANLLTPANNGPRASSSKTISFATTFLSCGSSVFSQVGRLHQDEQP